ncbi:unnamed protein product [Pedinophyceae sp. YPF-701]|nr:unnamed protein product [Pedinophyceae sp. YPF-701]
MGPGTGSSKLRKDDYQQYILRCYDVALAERLRKSLRDDDQRSTPEVRLQFDEAASFFTGTGDPSSGKLSFNSEQRVVFARKLPTVVESYKTRNDIDLVKIGEIGDILVVQDPDDPFPHPPKGELADGLTPAMRSAAANRFRPDPKADPSVVKSVENDLVRLIDGGAPVGCTIVDVEEEWDDGLGRYVPAVAKKKVQNEAPALGGGGVAPPDVGPSRAADVDSDQDEYAALGESLFKSAMG